MALLEVVGLSRRFGGVRAVDGVDFHTDQGEIVGVIGPNGAGKTTLFNIVTGFYDPDEGSILFDGHTLPGLKPNQITKLGIARTFQAVRLFPNMTVLENIIEAPIHVLGKSKAEAIADAEALLDKDRKSVV